jgi:ABC-type lipoprotein export system ATPase subunit
VLRQINLEINDGEFITIMGPSGAGKSTLLNIIGMLDSMSEGEYHFLGESVHKLNERKRVDLYKEFIGFIFQSYHLIDELTVYENLDTPLIYKKIKSSQRKSMVCDTLDRFQIVGKKGIARAIIAEPKLLLADEPTGNLHSEQGKEIMDLLKKLNDEGTTILQVTHSDKNAAYGNRIVKLLDGWIED